MDKKNWWRPEYFLVIVAALGYFVDIYDLILFNVVRKPSLQAIGLSGQAMTDMGIYLFNMQMTGMLLGGILWGILGDMRGRLKVLFGSIFLYSIANIVNAYVADVPAQYAIHLYALTRFLAGVGLAGELGAGITLVVETLHREKRGYGTMVVVTFGALGAVVAALVATKMGWKSSYWVGGLLGLALLALRIGTLESNMYKSLGQHQTVKRGAFLSLFTSWGRFAKYLQCILIGLPVWFIVAIPIAMVDAFATHFGITDVSVPNAVMYGYIGLSAGDLVCGILSQVWQTRKKAVLLYLVFSLISVLVYLFNTPANAQYFYIMCFVLGAATGYWALFVTIAAEQFGTNIRSTVTTTVPNFVRGAVVPITLSYKYLAASMGIINAALVVGVVCLALAFWATFSVHETFSKDLDYIEAL